MLTSRPEGPAVVTRLRMRGVGLDPVLTRVRATGLLSATDLRPRALSPAAIICIRALRDPVPGGLPLRRSGFSAPSAWEQAVARSLEDLARRAARPALGPVPPGTDCVLFADESELLACLALDRLSGDLPLHWWWRSLYREVGQSQVVVDAWLRTPAHVPAALQHLAERGRAVDFARSLSAHDARALADSVCRTFGLALVEAWPTSDHAAYAPGWPGESRHRVATAQASDAGERPRPSASPSADHRSPHQARAQTEASPGATRAGAEAALATGAPWQSIVPESADPVLSLDQHWLLGLGLLVCRAPRLARSAGFGSAVQQWRAAQAVVTGSGLPVSTSSVDRQLAAPSLAERPTTRAFRSGAPTDALVDGCGASPATELREATIVTELGGVFYLLNVSLSLGLYGDFTTPAEPGLDLSIWDFVALVARRLLAAAHASDPIWRLLAQLSGRSADDNEVGHSFAPPTSWRLPPDWLHPFPERGPLAFAATPRRLRVRHPAGFVLLDVPRAPGDAARQLQTELAAYPSLAIGKARRATAHGPPRGPLDRWLGWLTPYIAARLGRALGLVDGQKPAHLLCEHSARVYVTPSHLDVVLSLADLPIQVRLSGLDRDPGWIPAAGRIVAFHFD
jgi:hypothetical protein